VGEASWVWEILFRHLDIIYFSHHQPWVFWEIFLFRFGEYLFSVHGEGILQVGAFCMYYIFFGEYLSGFLKVSYFFPFCFSKIEIKVKYLLG
jgi:hypothetical protein